MKHLSLNTERFIEILCDDLTAFILKYFLIEYVVIFTSTPLYIIKGGAFFVEIHYENPIAAIKLGEAIKSSIDTPFITICIGTDRCIGDCLGPIIGHKLKENHFPYPVYGTLKNPIHAVNMLDTIPSIQSNYPNLPILAIDASLGSDKSIGKIYFRKGAVSPGKGVGKALPNVGDYSFIGIVDTYNHVENLNIHQVRLHLIWKIAEVMVESLFNSIKKT